MYLSTISVSLFFSFCFLLQGQKKKTISLTPPRVWSFWIQKSGYHFTIEHKNSCLSLTVFPLKRLRFWPLISAACPDSAAWGSRPPAPVDPSPEETSPWPCPPARRWRWPAASSSRLLSPPFRRDSVASPEVVSTGGAPRSGFEPLREEKEDPQTEWTSTSAAAAGGCGVCCAGNPLGDCRHARWAGRGRSWRNEVGCRRRRSRPARTAGCGKAAERSSSCTVRLLEGRTSASRCASAVSSRMSLYTGDHSKGPPWPDCQWSLNQNQAAPQSHRAALSRGLRSDGQSSPS